jgi:phospholipid transport system substrate-binding protein
VVLLGLVLVAWTPAWAGPPTDQLRGHVDRVIKVLDDPELLKDGRQPQRRAAIREVANDIFDFTEISRRSLGRHWAQRTPPERDEFVRLFTDLLERSYISKIEGYAGEKVTYAGDTIEGDQATVRTRIVTRQGTDVPVDYRMLKNGDRWRAYDVSIEGVSLVSNYRSQFNGLIQRQSYQELVKALRAKVEEKSEDRERRPKPGGAAPRGEEAVGKTVKQRQDP